MKVASSSLMSRMAPLVGREMIERLFIEVFGHLCLSASFHIWKFRSFTSTLLSMIIHYLLKNLTMKFPHIFLKLG
ncbi:uncharacterized protein LOC143249061 isoform X2 [Tachypleus tridentatus]|uniref:uncharacterized protein LOC143249061 isoform X2 n=1 Tax=Tachypleus tridentatus TaxID=6853 RepID=UPI003FD5D8F5